MQQQEDGGGENNMYSDKDSGSGSVAAKRARPPIRRESTYFQHRKMHHVSPGELFSNSI